MVEATGVTDFSVVVMNTNVYDMTPVVKGAFTTRQIPDTLTSVSAEFRQLLLQGYLDWQKKIGKRGSVSAYADSIGFQRGTFTNYMNGKRVPRAEKELEKLAAKLGLEVYDTLGNRAQSNLGA